jgi:hypothetical protein
MKAGSCNRPQRTEVVSINVFRRRYKMASINSRPCSSYKNLENKGMCGTADLNDRPSFFMLCPFSICNVDLMEEEGKLGYGFTSADELEEIDIGPGDKP